MKKKLFTTLMALAMTTASFAQFEAGKFYAGASLSGLNASYNGSEKGKFDLGLKGGYMFEDDWMITADLDFHKYNSIPKTVNVGVGVRYYIEQNGLYLGAKVGYAHGASFDDFQPGVQVGYAFFLSRTVTIEPELYYNQSLKSHSDYSTVGLRIGIGVYL